MIRIRRLAVLPLLLLSGCSPVEPKPDPFVGWYKDFRDCRSEYAEIDARVAAAGVTDAGYYRVPGYPYLRTDRVLASFAHEVSTLDQIGGWIRRMREYDQEAREFEYRNLGMTMQQAAIQRHRFLNCGRTLAAIEFLDEPAAFVGLLSAVRPRDEYSSLQRVLGFYPLAAIAMRTRVAGLQRALDAAYAQPLPEPARDIPLRLWAPRPEAELSLIQDAYAQAYPDELGFPGLVDSQWRALAEYHAPQLWIETASEADRPALPVQTANGPAVDLDRTPQAHYQVTFTRFGGRPLVQLNYLFWFKSANGSPLDGLIWRVTLDERAQPLVYESMHASGLHHRWYPVQELQRREPAGDREAPVIAPGPAPARLATLRLSAARHQVLRVVDPGAAASASVQAYELRRYEDLLSLPLPEGRGTRSLFGPDGLVAGTHEDDPVGGFASGIRTPGALRQLGKHAIAHVGRVHFDEPFLLESVFVPPVTSQAPAQTPAQAPPPG